MTLSKVISGSIFSFDKLGLALSDGAAGEVIAYFRELTARRLVILNSYRFSIARMVDQIAATVANRRRAKQ
ncbi:MAG: hypothetical protein ACKOAM_06370 [Chakrabartia sp.]